MHVLKQIIKSDFLKNLSVIASGTALAQIVTIACTPIFTRMYDAEAFGIFGIFMALVSIISCIATGSYNMAVMLPKEDSDAIKLLVLACLFSLFTGSVLLLFLPFSGSISQLLGTSALAPYLIWLPATIVASGCFQALGDWVGRNKNFALMSSAVIVGAIASNGWKLGVGLFDSSANGLIVSTLLMFMAQAFVLLLKDIRNFHWAAITHFDLPGMMVLAQRYRQLPIYRAPKNLLYALAQNAPPMMLSIFFSADKVGFFLLVDRVLGAPSILIGESVRRVYFQRAAEIHRDGRSLHGSLNKLTLGLAAIGAIPFLAIIVFGPQIFEIVFGDRWLQAGVYSRWIAISMFFIFIAIPSVVVIPVLRLERFFLVYEVISLVARIAALLIGSMLLKSDVEAIMLYAISGAVLNSFFIAYVVNKARAAQVSVFT